jgi:diaminohydroxyphosphoribosylaminopyrimidine deaminase/5-amino-6-(5-phosphoribosylamino)uracil reductase
MASPAEIDAMRLAIALSALGLGTTSPNPPVGCVILDPAGQVVGTGYHRRKGQDHAEAQALAVAGTAARGGTAVVSLEPCNHTGLTPACRQALLDAGITRVVISMADPTSRGEGGAAALRAAGVCVEAGVLQEEARLVLGPWLTATLRHRPHLTWAYAAGGDAGSASSALRERLSYQQDVLLHADGRAEEAIPGSHGAGMLTIPATGWNLPDPAAGLSVLFDAGTRRVLAVGDAPEFRSLLDHGLVDLVVIAYPRELSTSSVPVPPRGCRLEGVLATPEGILLTTRPGPSRPS